MKWDSGIIIWLLTNVINVGVYLAAIIYYAFIGSYESSSFAYLFLFFFITFLLSSPAIVIIAFFHMLAEDLYISNFIRLSIMLAGGLISSFACYLIAMFIFPLSLWDFPVPFLIAAGSAFVVILFRRKLFVINETV